MKINYRPEIDGLRAIAVFAVIFYHAEINFFNHEPFKGGFIGVDIFFIISGYLISSIILKELFLTNNFSFKNFYERRIRRIVPALLFVICITLPFSWLYLLPEKLVNYSKSVIFSIGFSSNIYFHFSDQQYAAESALLKPLLHTWSLSVEEQYYILFPIILLIIFKYFNKKLIQFLITGFIVSLIFANWKSQSNISYAFYFIQTRTWELLSGSILAYYEIVLGHRNKNKFFTILFPKIGFLLIILTIVFFKLYFPHPSMYTFVPVLGTCLIIWFAEKDEFITKILSSKYLVKIGLLSYSLYLWHYPVFAFARISNFIEDSLLNKLFLLLITIILSYISYYLIEKPGRNRSNRFLFISTLSIITISALLFVNLNIILKNGYKDRFPEILSKNFSQRPWELLKDSNGNICHNYINGCEFNSDSNKKIFILGDSHIGSLTFDLKEKIINKDYQFFTYTIGCLYFPDFDRVDLKRKEIDVYCNNNYFKKIKKILSNQKDSIIIFGGRFPLHFSNYFFDNLEGGVEGKRWNYEYVPVGEYKTIIESFYEEIKTLSKNNSIILIYPIPEVGWDPNKKISQDWIRSKIKLNNNFSIENINTSYEVYKSRTKTSFKLFDSIKGKNIYRVYPHTLFCNTIIKNRCIANDSKNIFYSDDSHPSTKGAEMINKLIMKELEKIEFMQK